MMLMMRRMMKMEGGVAVVSQGLKKLGFNNNNNEHLLKRMQMKNPFCSQVTPGIDTPTSLVTPPLLMMELFDVDRDLSEKLFDWLMVCVYEVEIPPNRTLVYRSSEMIKFPIPLTFTPPFEPLQIKVSPITQIFSTSVETKFDDQRPCGLYGSIKASDGQGTFYNLYRRMPSDCESFWRNCNLKLGPSGGAISRFVGRDTSIDLYLKDKIRDIEVIYEKFVLHDKSEDIESSTNKLLKAEVNTEHGYACVYYVTFRYAVLANIKIALFETQADQPETDIHGIITASYANADKYCGGNVEDVQFMRSILFSKSSKQSVRMNVGTLFPLLRSVVAVPADHPSSLIIEVDLWDSQVQFAKGSIEFTAYECSKLTKLVEGRGGRIAVDVKWRSDHSRQDVQLRDHSLAVGNEGVFGECTSRDSKVAGNNTTFETDEASKNLTRMHNDLRLPPVLSPWGPVSICSEEGSVFTEIFSIHVEGTTHKVSALCGTVQLYGYPLVFPLFERLRSNPQLLVPDRSIATVEGHSAINSCCIEMEFDLKDADRDLEVSKGRFIQDVQLRTAELWYNQHLCSVVRGEHGYAAVHYMFITSAVPAALQIIFFFRNPDTAPASVYGCLFAHNSNNKYSTLYEKKYFQNRLFDKLPSECVQLTHGAVIPLLKTVVAVPKNGSLIIESDLRVMCPGNPDAEVCNITQFEFDASSTIRKEICGKHYGIEVSVKLT